MNSLRQKGASRNLVLTFLYVSVLVPIVPILMWSFSFRWTYPNLMPEWSTRAWQYALNQRTILEAVTTSLTLSTIVTVLSLVIGFSAAKALGTRDFKGKSAVEIFILLPSIVPVISAVMGMQGVLTRLRLSDTLAGVVLAQLVFTMPYMVMGLSSVFRNYNMEYEQQASTLGANQWNILIHVTIPAIFPGLVVSCLFAFVVSWSQYLLTVVIGGSAAETLPLLVFALMGSGDYSVACATTIIFILPVLLLLILTSKYLTTNGVSIGGINAI
jgi:putative spermidine/putrescine transport system permease protein